MLNRLDHIAFRVADIIPVVEFYTSSLGFRIVQLIQSTRGL